MGSPNRCAWGYKTGGTSRALRDLLLWSSPSCHPNPVTSSKSIPRIFQAVSVEIQKVYISLVRFPSKSFTIPTQLELTLKDATWCFFFQKAPLTSWTANSASHQHSNLANPGWILSPNPVSEWGTSMAQPPFVRRLPNLPSSSNSPGRTALKGPCSRIGCTTAREAWLAPSFWVFQAFQSCLSGLSVQSFFCFLRDHPHYVLTLADLTDCKNLWKERHISRPLRTLTCSKPRKRAQRLQQEPFKGRTWW